MKLPFFLLSVPWASFVMTALISHSKLQWMLRVAVPVALMLETEDTSDSDMRIPNGDLIQRQI
jgi:hypothetical protein